MYLINDTYFKDLEIPNIDEANSKSLSSLIRIIDQKCRFVLRNCLPSDQFAELDSFIDPVTGTLGPLAPSKWLNLVNGVSYQNQNGLTNIWKGLIWTEGTYKGSLLAYFCYYHYLLKEYSFLSGVGEVRAEAKNATNVYSSASAVSAWNTFVSMYQGNFSPCGCVGYSGFDYKLIYDYPWYNYTTIANYEISLLQFLVENPQDYPDLKPTIYELQNVWGV